MFPLSFGEIVVVLMFAIILTKPDDVPLIMRKFYKIKKRGYNYFKKCKEELCDELEYNNIRKELDSSQEEIYKTKKDVQDVQFKYHEYLEDIVDLTDPN